MLCRYCLTQRGSCKSFFGKREGSRGERKAFFYKKRFSLSPAGRGAEPHTRVRRRAEGAGQSPAGAWGGAPQRMSAGSRNRVELAVIEGGVEAAPGEELVVGALLYDAAVVHYEDNVGVAYR